MAEVLSSDVPDDPRDRVIWDLRRAELAVQNLKDRRLRPIGMTASHYALLMTVHSEPGSAGAALARQLNVTPQAVASLVSRLVDSGLIERRRHPRHAHVQELHLTDAGRDALRLADEVMDGIEQQIVDVLGAERGRMFQSMLADVAASLAPVRDDQPGRSGS